MPAVRSPGERLALSLRTCSTHPAGPLRTVAELQEERERQELSDAQWSAILDEGLARYLGTGPPLERARIVQLFVQALR
jgi:hypothetical protein